MLTEYGARYSEGFPVSRGYEILEESILQLRAHEEVSQHLDKEELNYVLASIRLLRKQESDEIT